MSKSKPILPLAVAPSWLIKAAASELTFWRKTRKVDGLAIASLGTTISRAHSWDLGQVKSVLGQVSHIDLKLVEAMASAQTSEEAKELLFPKRLAEQLMLL